MQLSDFGMIKTGKTPSTKHEEFWGGDIPFVTPGDIQGSKHIFFTARNISSEGMNSVKGVILPPNAICVSCIGNIGYVGITTSECITNQQINSIIVNDEHNPDYVYYVIKSLWPFFKHYEGQSTTLSILNKSQFSKIIVEEKRREEEDAIATVLSSLDDKIELNNRINENLEQQAVAVYKSWFCDYSLTDGVRPTTWVDVSIDDLTELVTRGITPNYNDDSDQFVLNQKCIRNHTIDFSPARRHIPKAITEKWLVQGDLLINSTGEGTLGRVAQVWFTPQNTTVDSHITIVRPLHPIFQNFLGFWGLTHEKEIEALHTGSTGQTELPRERVKAMKLILPDAKSLKKFNDIVTPFTQMIVLNQKENIRLSCLRDALLPKLMSGEVDVSEVEL